MIKHISQEKSAGFVNLNNLPINQLEVAAIEDECEAPSYIGWAMRFRIIRILTLALLDRVGLRFVLGLQREILGLKFGLLRLQLSNFRLECALFFQKRRVRKLLLQGCCVATHVFPAGEAEKVDCETPNV